MSNRRVVAKWAVFDRYGNKVEVYHYTQSLKAVQHAERIGGYANLIKVWETIEPQ